MEFNIDIIVDYMRLFINNMYVYYCFEKISNNRQNHIRNNIILVLVNILLVFVFIPIKNNANSVLLFLLFGFIYTIVLSRLTGNKFGYSIIVTLMAYAVTFVAHIISVTLQFIPYKMLYKLFLTENRHLSLIIISLIEFALLYAFFKIRRFKNGFSFINNKLNNEITDLITINISSIIIIIYCLFIVYQDEIAKNLFITFLMIGTMMFFTIKKMITMYYKQKLLTDTMEEYKKEIAEKQNEIDKLKSDKQSVSKITHEFYNRQKALELLVAGNMNPNNIDKENASQNVLNIIESLTSEYSQRFEEIKELPKLDKTDIPEIDNMFTYMQSECNKNNIEFNLKIVGSVHSLVNNIIPKNKLETLIGDHLRDAINAVNLCSTKNKEILAVLGIKIGKILKGAESVQSLVEPLLYNNGICDEKAVLNLYDNLPAKDLTKPNFIKSKKGLGIIIALVLGIIALLPVILAALLIGFIVNYIKYHDKF